MRCMISRKSAFFGFPKEKLCGAFFWLSLGNPGIFPNLLKKITRELTGVSFTRAIPLLKSDSEFLEPSRNGGRLS